MSIKRKQIVLVIEFFRNQDPIDIESILRELAKKKKFPAFSTIIPMISAYNVRQVKSMPYPLVIKDEDIRET